MEEFSQLNRRFLAKLVNSTSLDFASWEQEIANMINTSGKLQKLNNEFYVEFQNNENSYLVGVDVIGMDSGLPQNGVDIYDSKSCFIKRFELEEVPALNQLRLELNEGSDQMRLVRVQNWLNNELEYKYYYDLIKFA